MLLEPLQTTIEDGIPLSEVTFAVVDLETTGGSAIDDAITEIGAVTYRGGERLGSFGTLVDPRRPIPPYVAHLTGISDATVAGAPALREVLPSLLEFLRGAVFVAHNASFDFGFLNASLARLEYPLLTGPPVCTAKLARRVVWPDVPNVRLATLARYFRTRTTPVHRALADAEATGEVLTGLLEAAERLGIRSLGELHEACSARGRPNYGKIALAASLPRAPGVYLFEDRGGRVLYVGKAKDLRARVKSYFYGDERKKVQDLLEAVVAVRGVRTGGELEALALEARLIARHEPRFNAHGKRWRRYAYLKLDLREAWPRIKVVRTAAAEPEVVVLGPFGSTARARLAKEALEHVTTIRRCTASMGTRTRFAPCALADMGRCAAPCDGRTTPEAYAAVARALVGRIAAPEGLLRALETRMIALADQERFEEAALARDRLRAVAVALAQARTDAWLLAGRLVLRGPDGERIELDRGAVVRPDEPAPVPLARPVPRERADELAAVRGWIRRHPVRIERCAVAPSEPVDGGAALARILESVRRPDAREDRGTGGPRGRR
ncbi:MAG TPA: DEDD exonuclease domain-containing protein [Actinomycetota bacterium]|nr:DEDD exonuclease domain-containing protein [Actinomycetota bacterium]